jgi:formylglycine-generating enzyme required for sulfatase activity
LLELEKRRILRTLKSGEQTQYEISHDVLALAVGKNRTREMELRARAAEVYKLYEDRENWFSQDEIDFLRPFSVYREYPPRLAQRVKDSEDKIRETKEAELNEARENEERERQLREKSDASRRRATLFARGASLLAVLALILAIYAYNQQREAKLAQQAADSSARLAAEQRDIADINARQALEQRRLAEEKTEEARANLERAQAEESRARAALKQVKKEKNATEEQRRRAEDNYAKAQKATESARAAKEAAERNLASLKLSNEAGVRAFLQNAEENISSGDYREALKKINAASGLGVLFDTVKAAYVKNIAASLEAGEVPVAFESAQSGYDKGVLKGVESGDICLGIAQAFILNINYDMALLATRLAVRIGGSVVETSLLYYDLSYWYCETGSLEKSFGLLDTAFELRGIRFPDVTLDTVSLHGAMRKFDLQRYEFLHDRYYPKMVDIAGGVFSMVSPESDTHSYDSERPVYRVTLSSYSMSETEVTVFQFGLYCALSGLDIRQYIRWPNSGDHPVVRVSWYESVEYANWLSERLGKRRVITGIEIEGYTMQSGSGYRLPTESEWEYAARGGSKSKGSVYAGGDNLALVGWYGENSGDRTHPVGEKAPNELGLYDMSGNVWEWCWDRYGAYKPEPQENPVGAVEGADRVIRGGSWSIGPRGCRAANRSSLEPSYRGSVLGFRLALSLQ